jgi:hypothetical protein
MQIKNSNEINEIIGFVTFSDPKIKSDADGNYLAVINKKQPITDQLT